MSDGRRGRAWLALARAAVSAGLLWLVARQVDAAAVLARLADLRAPWVAFALALTVPQVLLLAWRWRFTAGRLGIDLPFRVALGEYYLGILLNQVLPGGVLGDVSRAWRHARGSGSTGPAVRAVILERISAQLVMTLVAIACVLALPWAGAAMRAGLAVVVVAALAGALVATLRPRTLGATVPAAATTTETGVRRMGADARQAVLARDAVGLQLSSAVLVVGSYIAVFLVAARAVGIGTPLTTMLPLVAPVLMTMLVPLTVAGWGVREAAAAWLWSLMGLGAEEGAAISVAYGLIVLASSAPGVIVLVGALSGRGRTARPPPG